MKIIRNHVLVETYVCVRCNTAAIPKLFAAAPGGAAGYLKILFSFQCMCIIILPNGN
jgi:hypothetical protein